MSLSSYTLRALSLRQKIIIVLLFSSVILGIIGVYIAHSEWIFSLICGCLSYILLMIVTFQSIHLKIMQKIQEADTEQKLLKYASRYDDEMQDITQQVTAQDSSHTQNTLESLHSIKTQNSHIYHTDTHKTSHTDSISATHNKASLNHAIMSENDKILESVLLCANTEHRAQSIQDSTRNLNSNNYAQMPHLSTKQQSESTSNTNQAAIQTFSNSFLNSQNNKSCQATNTQANATKPTQEAIQNINKETIQELDNDLHAKNNAKKHGTNNKPDKKEKGKERTKFLDLSKASLGFELSFSLPRILVFIGMIVCCVILVWFKAFYPFVYLFGVFLGVVLIMCFLFVKQWCEDFTRTS